MKVNLEVLLDFYNNHFNSDEFIQKFKLKKFEQKTPSSFEFMFIHSKNKPRFDKLCWIVQKYLKFSDDNIIESKQLTDDIRKKMRDFTSRSTRIFETAQYHPPSSQSQSSYNPTQCQCDLCTVDSCPSKTKIQALELKIEQQEQEIREKMSELLNLKVQLKLIMEYF